MKPSTRLFSAAAMLFAFAVSTHAQLQTYQTLVPDAGPPPVNGYSGSVQTFNGSTRQTQGQVFTNVLAIDSMTYNLFTTGTPAAAQLSAAFGQWDTTLNQFVGPTLQWSSINVPSYTSWTEFGGDLTFELEFDITALNGSLYTTNPSLSYALMISQESAGLLGFGIGQADLQSDFAYGYGLMLSSTGVASPINTDFTFTQISVEPGPVPEASTVAALIGAAFIAGLVGLRLRQRRQLAALPAAA